MKILEALMAALLWAIKLIGGAVVIAAALFIIILAAGGGERSRMGSAVRK